MIAYFDIAAVFVAGLSGALLAARKEMDVLAFFILGVVTAIGGGTIRDLVLDLPVFWVEKERYLIVSLVASASAFAIARKPMNGLRRWFFLRLDAAAMALFSVTGSIKALQAGAPISVAILMGVITATAGGLMRDVIANETPVVMRGEIFALAAAVGAFLAVFCVFIGVSTGMSMAIGFACAFFIRLFVISRGIKLDVLKRSDEL